MRLRIHPLFFALALLLILFGQAAAFLWTLAAVCLHEAGHAVAARARGYVVKSLVLYPYGAAMSAEEEMDRVSCVVVGLAGPAANLLAAAVLLALWWLFPAAYVFTRQFLFANVAIALFNLLPVYPLDGSRVAAGLSGNRLLAMRRMQRAGVAVSVLLFALFILSCALKAAVFTAGIAAVFLFAGAALGGREDAYVSVLAAGRKNYLYGVRKREVVISADAPLVRLFHHVDGRSVTTFRVVEERGEESPPEEICVLEESALRALASSGRLSDTLRKSMTKVKAPAKGELPPAAHPSRGS